MYKKLLKKIINANVSELSIDLQNKNTSNMPVQRQSENWAFEFLKCMKLNLVTTTWKC